MLFCDVGTLMGVDMVWSLALFPIALIYAYYSRHELRAARRAGVSFPIATRRLMLVAGVYASVALVALCAEQLLVGGIYGGHVVDVWGHARVATRADHVREHAFLVFGLLGLAALFFAYPTTRAITSLTIQKRNSLA